MELQPEEYRCLLLFVWMADELVTDGLDNGYETLMLATQKASHLQTLDFERALKAIRIDIKSGCDLQTQRISPMKTSHSTLFAKSIVARLLPLSSPIMKCSHE
jgi:hypothetical protein